MGNDKSICHQCVGEKFISAMIKKKGSANDRCSYCRSRRKTISLPELAESMHTVFSTYYRCRADEGLYPGYSFGNPAEDIIAECLEVDEDISAEIHEALKENYNDGFDGDVYSEDYVYKEKTHSSEALDNKWEEIKKSLQNEARFFNNHVKDFFDKIFSGIETHRTQDGRNAVNYINNDMPVFRARVFDSYDKVEEALQHPERHFGPPPHLLATSGRMNAQGIPVFYGASSPNIAIAEVRPAVGSLVVVAQFSPLKPLRILEISALDELSTIKNSLFDPQTAEKFATACFLRKLSRKLTLPVSGKKTDTEYLITQAISEYLSLSDIYKLDGISFKSTQQTYEKNEFSTPYNIVLFNRSSAVLNADVQNTRYSVNIFEYDDDDETSYSWLEPEIRKIETVSDKLSISRQHISLKDYSLQLNASEMTFHIIKGVVYQKTEYPIKLGKPKLMKADSSHEFFGDEPF